MRRTSTNVLMTMFLYITLSSQIIQAQIFFETRVSNEVAVLENPSIKVMSNIKVTTDIPDNIKNIKWESDVKITEILDIAHDKKKHEIAYGSIVRITGKAFRAVYEFIDITTSGSVRTGKNRIEKVGQPTTRLDISGLTEDLYYAGKLWRPKNKEKSYIHCSSEEIIGVNVIVKNSPWKDEPLRKEDKSEKPPSLETDISDDISRGLPSWFQGVWIRIDDPNKQSKIIITEKMISWVPAGVNTEMTDLETIVISENGKKLVCPIMVTVAERMLKPSSKLGRKATAKLSLEGEELVVEISGIKERVDASGLFAWKPGTVISREEVDGKILTYVEYPTQFYRYRKTTTLKTTVKKYKLVEIKPPSTSKPVKCEADGKIIFVDREAGVVHLNIGAQDGVRLGLTFSVFDHNTPISSDNKEKSAIEVYIVLKHTSQARIIHSNQKNPVKAGDTAVNLVWDSGKTNTFVLVGEFDLDDDKDIEEDAVGKIKTLIEKWGGAVTDTVSADTDFVILGNYLQVPEKPTAKDLEEDPKKGEKYKAALAKLNRHEENRRQAQALRIPILEFEKFLDLIGFGKKKQEVQQPLDNTSQANEVPMAKSMQIYVVKRNDTLYFIAEKIYGDASKWKTILDANPQLRGKPLSLRVGMKLRIPEN